MTPLRDLKRSFVSAAKRARDALSPNTIPEAPDRVHLQADLGPSHKPWLPPEWLLPPRDRIQRALKT